MTTLTAYSDQVTSSAQYSIDGGSIIEFQVANGTSAPHYNLISFQTPKLSPGSHRLFVEYGANNPDNAAPLRLDKLVIQNLTYPSSTPSPTTASGKLSAGALSGVVIGSLVGSALIIFGLIWVIRFIKRKLSLSEQAVPYIKTYGDDHDRQLQGDWNDRRQSEENWNDRRQSEGNWNDRRQSEGNWNDRQLEGNSSDSQFERTLIA